MDSDGASESLLRLVETSKKILHDIVPISEIILFGSHARRTASSKSDVDVLVIVAPSLQVKWTARENLILAAALRAALHFEFPRLDIQVRTIDQYEEAHGVPVCPEHSASSEGVLLFSAATCRRPIVRRSEEQVRRQNAADWLRFGEHALCALRRAEYLQRVHGSADESDDESLRQLIHKHYEKSVRSGFVVYCLAHRLQPVSHKARLAELFLSDDPRLMPYVNTLLVASDTRTLLEVAAVAMLEASKAFQREL